MQEGEGVAAKLIKISRITKIKTNNFALSAFLRTFAAV
jgi:hypothetical protein